MKKAMSATQWVLGVLASLSLIVAIVYKFVFIFSYKLLSGVTPKGLLWLSAVCSLVSIALSLIKIGKLMEESKK